MSAEERKALVERRIECAYETWEETKCIVDSGYWLAAANLNAIEPLIIR